MANFKKPTPLSEFLAHRSTELLSCDPTAFTEFVSVLLPEMKKYFLKQFRSQNIDDDIAEHLANQVAFRLFMIIDGSGIKRAQLTLSYIYRTAKSVGIDYLRKERPREEQLPHDDPVDGSVVEGVSYIFAAPDEEYTSYKRQQCLKAFDLLSESGQAILWMRYVEAKSFEEIAAILNITEAAARQQVSRAERRARRNLEKIEDT
jgi:RNA polymerase sigma factor (sigma-70 family)